MEHCQNEKSDKVPSVFCIHTTNLISPFEVPEWRKQGVFMPFFIVVPALMILFFLSCFMNTFILIHKGQSSYSWDRVTNLDKVWFYINVIVFSCFW